MWSTTLLILVVIITHGFLPWHHRSTNIETIRKTQTRQLFLTVANQHPQKKNIFYCETQSVSSVCVTKPTLDWGSLIVVSSGVIAGGVISTHPTLELFNSYLQWGALLFSKLRMSSQGWKEWEQITAWVKNSDSLLQCNTA